MPQLVEVTVKQGLVRGERLTPPHGVSQFDAFLGLPYAKPPVGSLRFRAPQPPEPWEGARPALSESARSIQRDFITQKVLGREDCLYLNVYTPQVPASVRHPVEGAPWPVMVWFFPGGFTNGDHTMKEFSPEHLCAKGVVVVSVSYRLGALGFLSLGSKTLPGNAGLKDGIAALRWVQENVSVFGGDPSRVTVFGCSAGGAYAEYLQYAPAARGLFQRAISQSGAASNQWASVIDQSLARTRAFRLGKLLGCDTQDEAELLAFLQEVPALDIFNKSDECVDPELEGSQGLLFAFLPCSEAGTEGSGEDAFLADSPRRLLYSGRFFPVPWMTGFSDCEGLLTLMNDGIVGREIACSEEIMEKTDKDLERVVPAVLKLAKGSAASKAIADGVRQLYFNGGVVNKNGYLNLYSDLLFAHGIHEAARLHAAHPAAQPVFVYLFCVIGELNRLSKFLKAENAPGACHGDELGYLFGCRPPLPAEPVWEPHSIEALTRKRMTALWTNFARTGNPTPANDPAVEGVVWSALPPSKAGPVSYLDISATLSTPSEPLLRERMAFWDDVYAQHFDK